MGVFALALAVSAVWRLADMMLAGGISANAPAVIAQVRGVMDGASLAAAAGAAALLLLAVARLRRGRASRGV
jgi:hypothetical protein